VTSDCHSHTDDLVATELRDAKRDSNEQDDNHHAVVDVIRCGPWATAGRQCRDAEEDTRQREEVRGQRRWSGPPAAAEKCQSADNKARATETFDDHRRNNPRLSQRDESERHRDTGVGYGEEQERDAIDDNKSANECGHRMASLRLPSLSSVGAENYGSKEQAHSG
jgi:hypothetical protein